MVSSHARLVLSLTLSAGVLAAPPQATPVPRLDPGAFPMVPRVSNPFFPLTPGVVFVYRVREGRTESLDSMSVTRATRRIGGVTAIVVHDRERRAGRIVEDTDDWYAQDTSGTVWYLGEATTSFEGKRPNTSGSWEHGVAGATAGIIMPAHPTPGAAYRQEYRRGVAEDMGRVVRVADTASVPARRFTDCISTEDWSPLEPGVRERKTYCRGVGLVRTLTIAGGHEVAELVAFTKR
jgi:hypothetical protein